MAQFVTLSEVCELNPKHKLTGLADDLKVSFVGMADVSEITRSIESSSEKNLSVARKGFTHFANDDIIVAKITPCYENGKIAVVKVPHEFAFGSTEFHVFRTNKEKLLPKFLFYFLSSPSVRNSGTKSMTGSAGQKRVPIKFFQKLKIPLPSLEDQKRIVRELDAADSLRQKRKKTIELLDDYLQAVFFEKFGDPVRNSKGWEVRSLGEMIDFMTSGSRGWAKYYVDAGDVFLRIQNVRNNHLKLNDLCFVNPPDTAESKRTKVEQGDVLLSITADLGRTAVIPENFGNAYISQHLALLRFKECYSSDYISEFLASQGGAVQMAKLNKGGTKAGLNFKDIKSIQIPLPDIKTQKQYISQKKYIQSLKQFMLSQNKELETNFNALIGRVFSEKH